MLMEQWFDAYNSILYISLPIYLSPILQLQTKLKNTYFLSIGHQTFILEPIKSVLKLPPSLLVHLRQEKVEIMLVKFREVEVPEHLL